GSQRLIQRALHPQLRKERGRNHRANPHAPVEQAEAGGIQRKLSARKNGQESQQTTSGKQGNPRPKEGGEKLRRMPHKAQSALYGAKQSLWWKSCGRPNRPPADEHRDDVHERCSVEEEHGVRAHGRDHEPAQRRSESPSNVDGNSSERQSLRKIAPRNQVRDDRLPDRP